MRVLWITNIIFPELSKFIGRSEPVGGGWVIALARQLNSYKEIILCITSVYNGREIKQYNIDGIEYYLLPSKSKTTYQKKLETLWKSVYINFKPDIIHIHGTEYTHGLAFMKTYPELKYIISVQGILSVIPRYYYAGINTWEIFKNITFRDIIRRDSIFHEKRKFIKRGILEKEYFMRSKHVIGRTNWDLVHSKMLNPAINYHFCNELLRDSFYNQNAKWNINNITQYTIFLSQSYYPIKGLHQLLKAMAIVKTDFPEIKLHIAGPNVLREKNFPDRIKLSGYGAYLLSIIKKNKLDEKIIFTGILDENQMVSEYKNAHIFICPSSIENSPNSLGEAQLIGVPCIAAYVGGIPDMIIHEESGFLYRFEEYEMLAFYIKRIFEDNSLALKFSENEKIVAKTRHNRNLIRNKMKKIYNEIINGK